MIERQVIGGESATVAYIKGDFEPATPDDYEMVKITFDNGRTVWARPTHKTSPTQPPPMPSNGAALDFEEAKVHRGGNPENTGEFSKGSGGGAKTEEGGKTEAAPPAPGGSPTSAPEEGELTRPPREALVGNLSIPKKDNTQNVKTLDELYEKALADEKQVNQNLKDIAAAVGGEAVFTPAGYGYVKPDGEETTLKGRARAEEKMRDDYGGDPSQLRDIVRGTIMCETTEQYRAAAKMFIDRFGDSIVEVKDRMVTPAPGGYRDILINYRTPSGLIAEVQFNSPKMLHLKNFGEGHRLFEQMRVIPKPPLTLRQGLLYDSLKERSERLYMAAYTNDGNTNWKTGEHHFGAGDERIVGDAMTNATWKHEFWKLTPPQFGSKPFYYRVVIGDKCYSTAATGQWQEDNRFHLADLAMPEQGSLNEWDVELLPGPPEDAPV